MPRLSVIINNYNYGRFLRQCIDSVLNQTVPADEVIVVDDGSTDESREIMESYGDRIVAVYKENGGQASAMNVGFAASSGDWVWFVDADDWLDPKAHERLRSFFGREPNRIQFELSVMDIKGRILQRIPKRKLETCVINSMDEMQKGHKPVTVPTTGNLFNRQFLTSIFPIPTETYRICADEYLLWSQLNDQVVCHVSETLGFYRQHDSNAFLETTLFRADTGWLDKRIASIERVNRLLRAALATVGDTSGLYSTQQLRIIVLAHRVGTSMAPPISVAEAKRRYKKQLATRQHTLIQGIKERVGWIIVRYLPLPLVSFCGQMERWLRPLFIRFAK